MLVPAATRARFRRHDLADEGIGFSAAIKRFDKLNTIIDPFGRDVMR
jgi:hypothetical protein